MSGPRILIIEARFYDDIADGLLEGVEAVLKEAGAEHSLITLPGIYEVPAAVAFALKADHESFDGMVTLGCAIKGETDHYEHISQAVMLELQHLAVQHCLALGNGILTVRNRDQAIERCRPERRDFGGQAARACLRMIKLKSELRLPVR